MVTVTCPKCGARNRVDERADDPRTRARCGRCGTPLEMSARAHDTAAPIDVTDRTLAEVLRSAGEKPVLVDCWAAWCGPCRMIAPTIDQLASESGGRYLVAKLDVDANPTTAATFQIEGIPALLIFKKGQLVDRLVGLQPKPSIVTRLHAQL